MNIKEFWAKTDPFQSVFTHSLVSGRVAQVLLKEYVSESARKILEDVLQLQPDELTSFVGYLVSLHDIGKLEYSFQIQNDAIQDRISFHSELCELFFPGVRHEKTGLNCLKLIWKQRGEDRKCSLVMAKIIGAHHQGKTGEGNFKQTSNWFDIQKELENQMRGVFLKETSWSLPQLDPERQSLASALLLGLTILSDWISSGPTFSDAEEWIDCDDASDRITAAAHTFVEQSGLAPLRKDWPESFCGLWPSIPAEGRRPLQVEIETLLKRQKEKPLLTLIEAPMGEGKTEAGIFAAVQMAKQWRKEGLYFALPTAATANQMIGRVQALLNTHQIDADVRLLRAMSWLQSDESYAAHSTDEQNVVASWLAPTKRGLLGQFAVGTVDQAMLAATNVKYGVLRLLGLSNKVLIIDEIHSYDAYMGEIIVRLLEWCKALEIPVVMLSATLPPSLKEKLLSPYTSQKLSGEYPLITTVDSAELLTERKIHQTSHHLEVAACIKPILGNKEQIAAAAVEEVQDGGCVCVLMNTVREAQEVYRAIKERFDGDLVLFHAQFPAQQRAEIEKACIRRYGKDKRFRPKRSILVATQVVEQSLDVDFDAMITAIAPMDLLLQRMGRVFRHEDTPRPQSHTEARLTVLCPEKNSNYGASSFVYPECLLNSAKRLLENKKHIRIPEDLAKLVREAYSPEAAPKEEAEQWMKKLLRDEVEAGASQRYLLNPPDKLFSALEGYTIYEDDGDSYSLTAQTRLAEPSVRIALLTQDKMELVRPFIREKNGQQVAAVWKHDVAETVMRQSVSVRISRLGCSKSGLLYIKGDSLLAGTWIFPVEDGACRLSNGKTLRYDSDLGLLIEEGET